MLAEHMVNAQPGVSADVITADELRLHELNLKEQELKLREVELQEHGNDFKSEWQQQARQREDERELERFQLQHQTAKWQIELELSKADIWMTN